MISTEVLRKIRHDRTRLLDAAAELRQRCTNVPDGELARVVETLDRELRDHLGLVDAVIEAMTEDVIEP